MSAVVPMYPLYPVACIIAALLLFLVLLSSFVRKGWNLGVAFLCLWLFLENLIFAANAILWSDNVDIKLHIYCDIVSRLQLVCYVVKPMATLLTTRRIYLVTRLRTVEYGSRVAERRDALLEWFLGLLVPILIAGPLYYTVQGARFEVDEGFGCTNTTVLSVVSILFLDIWSVLPALVSIVWYYPKIATILYRQNREFNHFLRNNRSITRTNYIRLLVLTSINIVLVTSINITIFISSLVLETAGRSDPMPFYQGWRWIHSYWDPIAFSWTDIKATGTVSVAFIFLSRCASIIIAFAIFGLFGLTASARATYWRVFCLITGCKSWNRIQVGRGDVDHPAQGFPEYSRGNRSQGNSLGTSELALQQSSLKADIAPSSSADMSAEGQIGLHCEAATMTREIGEPETNFTWPDSVSKEGDTEKMQPKLYTGAVEAGVGY